MIKVSKPASSGQSVGTVLIALIGPLTIWALHFSLLYGAHHIVCVTRGDSPAGFLMPAAASVATLAALLGLLFLIVKADVVLRVPAEESTAKQSRTFLTGVMRLLAILCCFGVIWAGSAAWFLPTCTSHM